MEPNPMPARHAEDLRRFLEVGAETLARFEPFQGRRMF
jgi:hypothetical protein